MIQLNVLVNDLAISQLNFFMIQELNTLSADGIANPVVYFENPHPPCVKPRFATMQMSEAWLQPGITIATSPQTAAKMIHFPRSAKKLFYVWDLYWLRPQYVNNILQLLSLFRDKQLELIARSTYHAQAIRNCFNRECLAIVEDFKIKDIICDETRTN